MDNRQTLTRERMTILGRLDVDAFVPWIGRHAARLGLAPRLAHAGPDRIELDVDGPAALLDMLEVGCSLGPIDVWVERIDRRPR